MKDPLEVFWPSEVGLTCLPPSVVDTGGCTQVGTSHGNLALKLRRMNTKKQYKGRLSSLCGKRHECSLDSTCRQLCSQYRRAACYQEHWPRLFGEEFWSRCPFNLDTCKGQTTYNTECFTYSHIIESQGPCVLRRLFRPGLQRSCIQGSCRGPAL